MASIATTNDLAAKYEALRADRQSADTRQDSYKAGCQVAKAAKLAQVLTRCGATLVVDDFTPPMWRMVVELAGVNPHSAAEPVSATVEAMVRALLVAQREGILAFGPRTSTTDTASRVAGVAEVTNRINASMGFVPVDL